MRAQGASDGVSEKPAGAVVSGMGRGKARALAYRASPQQFSDYGPLLFFPATSPLSRVCLLRGREREGLSGRLCVPVYVYVKVDVVLVLLMLIGRGSGRPHG